ncbi:S24 family peptidase [Methylobacterium oryzihabitans]|uniref:Peptidase S24/S26A/S26B/S26C domain-containing protein n=1 Tax=Methylobacterium oryzihabitans TaxID=2499852 RepID=A0A3S2YW43_9HYPH|nr:S24 family peptidase [Methylobacterium oryzihabitans]RVU20658.1 hypothetical protein EOE48_04735 [Methylobacterium oryzihabitans]
MADSSDASARPVFGFHDFMDDRLRDRISQAVTKLGGSTAAGEIVGVSDEAIGRWRRGPTKPPFPGVVALCRAAKFRVEWMATGEGPRDTGSSDEVPGGTKQEQIGSGMVQSPTQTLPASGFVMLPRLHVEALAGRGAVPPDDETAGTIALKEGFLRGLGVQPRNAHVLPIRGDSMYPTLKSGDVVIVDTSVIDVLEEGLYTLVIGGMVRAKRLQPLAGGGVRVISDNKAEGYADEVVSRADLDGLRIVGRIKGMLRQLDGD